MHKTIIGAGLAGLIAACRFPDADIIEKGGCIEQHRAVLRFRDESVSIATGIPFRRVRVDKSIFYRGEHESAANIALSNAYSMKVTGKLIDRSIGDLRSVERFIAPSDFYSQLVDRFHERVTWNTSVQRDELENSKSTQWINTAPLPVILSILDIDPGHEFSFEKKAITVHRFKLFADADVFQTVYFPQHDFRTYRASITGNELIIEMLQVLPEGMFAWQHTDLFFEQMEVVKAFGLSFCDVNWNDGEQVEQKYGKIVDLPRATREALLYRLTREYNVFSLGRFATWRNILLDDVAADLNMIERLMGASEYERTRLLATK